MTITNPFGSPFSRAGRIQSNIALTCDQLAGTDATVQLPPLMIAAPPGTQSCVKTGASHRTKFGHWFCGFDGVMCVRICRYVRGTGPELAMPLTVNNRIQSVPSLPGSQLGKAMFTPPAIGSPMATAARPVGVAVMDQPAGVPSCRNSAPLMPLAAGPPRCAMMYQVNGIGSDWDALQLLAFESK